MASFRAINATNAAPSGHAVASGSGTRSSQPEPRPGPQPEIAESVHADADGNGSRYASPLPDQEFPVKSIIDKRVRDGVVERLIEWECTQHNLETVERTSEGDWINVAGRMWRVRSRRAVQNEDGEATAVVNWLETWQPDWDLPKQLVAKYEQEHPTNDSRRRQAQWWEWEDQLDGFLDPEESVEPLLRGHMDEDTFVLDPDADYTLSFLELLRAELTLSLPERNWPGVSAEKFIAPFLNMHFRQGLRFRASLREKDLRAASPPEVRAMVIYIFGYANQIPCRGCQRLAGPFPKCVIWDPSFQGACANCTFLGCGKSCEYHHGQRIQLARKLRAQALLGSAFQEESLPTASQNTLPSSSSLSGPSFATASQGGTLMSSMPSQAVGGMSSSQNVQLGPTADFGEEAFLGSAFPPREVALPTASQITTPSSPPFQGLNELSSSPDLGDGREVDTPPSSPPSTRKQTPFPAAARASQANPAPKAQRPPVGRYDYFDLPTSDDEEESPKPKGKLPSRPKSTASSSSSKRKTPSSEWDEYDFCEDSSSELGPEEMKRLKTESAPLDLITVQPIHLLCTDSQRCVDGNAGCNAANLPPKAVIAGQKFERGELTDEQVKFIISRCSCRQTEMLQDFWEILLANEREARRPRFSVWKSKWTYLSWEYHEILQKLADARCPAPWSGEMIDLTRGDD